MRSLRKGLALERYVLYNQNNRQADWRKRFASRPESDSQAAKAAQFLRGEVMSKRKRLVSILALAAMTTSLFAGLAGCGKNEDPG